MFMSKQMLSLSQIRTPAKSQNCPTLRCHIIPLHTHLRSAKGRLSGASGYPRFFANTKEQHEPAQVAPQEPNFGRPAEGLSQTPGTSNDLNSYHHGCTNRVGYCEVSRFASGGGGPRTGKGEDGEDSGVV